MRVETVTTTNRSLLPAVRRTLERADEALLCVAFVQERGLRLIEREARERGAANVPARLLVTTTFRSTPDPALELARDIGLEVRVLNPGSGSTFHPKLYLGRHGRGLRAVIGSANLTGGLATNVEVAVALEGGRSDEPLALAWAWAESLWEDPRARPWQPTPGAAGLGREVIEDGLLESIRKEWRRDPVFRTLGRGAAANRVTDFTGAAVYVETDRSRERRTGSQELPAWMFNLAWDYLRTHGSLSNAFLLNELRVHRSSAVCAILARVPGVRVRSRDPIELEWVRSRPVEAPPIGGEG